MKSREGKCVGAAFDDMMGIFNSAAKHGDVVVVHGWVHSYNLNASIKHAWLEFKGSKVVYDPVSRTILQPKEQEKYHMRPMKRYDYWEMLKRSLKTGYKGGLFEF